MQVEQLLLISARRMIMLYISTKFCEIISISILENTKWNNSAKNVVGATVVNLCMSSGHALYLCQVS